MTDKLEMSLDDIINQFVSNLDYGVLSSDIQVIFSNIGPIHSATVNYEKSGRSMGSAYVVFERKADAVRAMKLYNRVPLDGRPMHIELTTTDVEVAMQQANRFSDGFTRRLSAGGFGHGVTGRGFRRNGRGEGRGDERAAKNKAPTAAELDAKLDAYISQRK
ncbi:THO complex subunit 4-like [Homalodisca vitripennis]|uniref:THO complex subunit 4-like n=1 Tax=Homalodisca vitripennis TaxID=197043 RepID=UPI001EE9FF53|nr:THO complex subunit 4-like [Homalodisca vitripennis]